MKDGRACSTHRGLGYKEETATDSRDQGSDWKEGYGGRNVTLSREASVRLVVESIMGLSDYLATSGSMEAFRELRWSAVYS